MENADDAANFSIENTTDCSSLVSTREMGGNIYGNDFTSIEDRSVFDRYTGIYDPEGLFPESHTHITRTRECFSAGVPNEYKEIGSKGSDSGNLLHFSSFVPYELSEC